RVYSGYFKTLFDTIVIGTGATNAEDVSAFGNSKAQRIQYIYLASELHAAGFSEGHIKAFGLKTGPSGGTLQRNNYTIHMGETHLEEFNSSNTFVPINRMQLVKGPSTDTLKSGEINMFKLDTGFIWDGVANIVVQIAYSDTAPSTNPTTIPVITTSFSTTGRNHTIFTKSSSANLTQLNATLTGTRSVYRMNGYFDVLEGCFGPAKDVEVVFKKAPPLVLSDTIANNCAGQSLDRIYVMTGANDFDEYEWVLRPMDPNNPNDPNDPANDNTHPNHPDNAISGDQNIGWTFNPTVPLTYYLTVKQGGNFPGGEECVNYTKVHVQLSPSPVMALQLHNEYVLCYDDIEELKIDNFIDETPDKYLFNGN